MSDPLDGAIDRAAHSNLIGTNRLLKRKVADRDAEIERLRAALEAYEKHMGEMQAAATRHLSIGHRQDEFVNAMLYLLDGPEQRAVQAITRTALTQEPRT